MLLTRHLHVPQIRSFMFVNSLCPCNHLQTLRLILQIHRVRSFTHNFPLFSSLFSLAQHAHTRVCTHTHTHDLNLDFPLVGFAGTPGYLSPEVLKKEPYGKPVDVWACGECCRRSFSPLLLFFLYLIVFRSAFFYRRNFNGSRLRPWIVFFSLKSFFYVYAVLFAAGQIKPAKNNLHKKLCESWQLIFA